MVNRPKSLLLVLDILKHGGGRVPLSVDDGKVGQMRNEGLGLSNAAHATKLMTLDYA